MVMTHLDPVHPDDPMVTLEDLPGPRREALLWRYALELDYAGVDADVGERSRQPCPWRRADAANDRVAVLGDDDRYHLLIDDRLLCSRPAARRRLRVAAPAYPHRQLCHWWIDGTRYQVQAPRGTARNDRGATIGSTARRVAWSVQLTQTRTDPHLIPNGHRCPVDVRSAHWPPPHDPATALGRVRITLIEALGADCHACLQSPGVLVDHDPFTTYVRGLLCGHCNTHVDTCPHPADCPWADYLNAPPAAPLSLIYPAWRKALQHQSTHRKIQMLGIDPFAELRTCPT